MNGIFKAQTKSFDDDFDTDSEDEIPVASKPAAKKEPVKNEEEEDDSDFEDPDLIEIPGGGKSLNTLKSGDAGSSMPPLFGKCRFVCLTNTIPFDLLEQRQEKINFLCLNFISFPRQLILGIFGGLPRIPCDFEGCAAVIKTCLQFCVTHR